MASQTCQIGFVGAGKLAGSVIRGLVRAAFCPPEQIMASEPSEQARAALQDLGIRMTTDNRELAQAADVVLIGLKPGVVLSILRELQLELANKLVISLAAGVRLQTMEEVSNARMMRAMTNTPATICRAATALARGRRTTSSDVDVAKEIFNAVGIVVDVNEDQIDVVTALSGSGPAFVYTIIENLANGAAKLGLSSDIALTLATQTVFGAAQLMSETKLSPEELRKMVVTPGGTTAAGLAAMEKCKTAEGLIAAVEAATKRGQEMAKENR
jgi:pyrroline-5-carboxylate reductase